jgi:hypothetical protein
MRGHRNGLGEGGSALFRAAKAFPCRAGGRGPEERRTPFARAASRHARVRANRLGRRQQRERVLPLLVRGRDDDHREVLIGPPRRRDPAGQDSCHGAPPDCDGARCRWQAPERPGRAPGASGRHGRPGRPPRGPGNATNAFQAATVSRTGNGIPWDPYKVMRTEKRGDTASARRRPRVRAEPRRDRCDRAASERRRKRGQRG